MASNDLPLDLPVIPAIPVLADGLGAPVDEFVWLRAFRSVCQVQSTRLRVRQGRGKGFRRRLAVGRGL